MANPAHVQDVAFLPDCFRPVKQAYSTLETSYRTALAPAVHALPSDNAATMATAMAIATYRFMSSLLVCEMEVIQETIIAETWFPDSRALLGQRRRDGRIVEDRQARPFEHVNQDDVRRLTLQDVHPLGYRVNHAPLGRWTFHCRYRSLCPPQGWRWDPLGRS